MEKEEKENSIDGEEEETEPNEGRSLSSDSASSEELHDALIHADKSSLIKLFEDNSAVQLADALLPLGNDQIVLFYSIISFDYDKLGEIFSYLSVDERISLVNNLPKKTIQAVLSNVPNDDLADFLEDITKALRSKILTYLPNKRRAIIEELALFSDDTVGSIRTTEYLSVLSGTTVEDVFKKIKAIGNQLETVRTIFVVDEKNKLLLKLKMTIGKITQDKNNFKKKLNDELAELANYKKEIKKNTEDMEKIKQMTARQDSISEERDKETNMLHNKLSKGGTLEINHHVREKTIEKELIHILTNLQKKLEIEKIKEKGIEEEKYY